LIARSRAAPNERRLRKLLAFHGFHARGRPLARSIAAFQEASHLRASGRLSAETLELLNARRCSHPQRALPTQEEIDRFQASSFSPARIPAARNEQVEPEVYVDTQVASDHEYDLIRARWSRRSLHYCLLGAAPGALQSVAWQAVRRALSTWTKAGVVSLAERTEPDLAELRVLWTPGPALDPSSQDPFYGPGGYVAVGYYPFPQFGELAGDLHFDTSETWTTTAADGGLDLETVALHELGHCLGLGHCRDPESIMWPVYKTLQHEITSADQRELERQYRGAPS
jgi:Matrixin